MLKTLLGSSIAAICLAAAAQAKTVDYFAKTSGEGVYSLTEAQADHLGHSGADRIAFVTLRKGAGVNYKPGDTFDASSVLSSIAQGRSNVGGVLNGLADDVTYDGDAFAPLSMATIWTNDANLTAAVALIFDSAADGFVTRDGTVFTPAMTQGAYDGILVPGAELPGPAAAQDTRELAVVPLPWALPLMLAALGGLALMRRARG